MKKKDVIFIIGLTLLMGIIWILGEVVMGLWIAAAIKYHIMWLGGIVLITLVISVWHSMLEDESGEEDPKKAKYRRKTQKRKRKKRS